MERILDTDLQDYKFLSGLKLLPDDRALVIAAKADLEDNCYRSDLYLVDCKTGAARPLTSHGDVRSFALFGDKSVIFPAIREKKDQKRVENGELLTVFYQLPLDGGESRECFRLPLQGASAHLVREGLYLITAVHDNARPDFESLKGEKRRRALLDYQEEKDYQVCDEAPFWFNGRGFVNKKRNRLWLYDVKRKKLKPVTEPMFDTRGFTLSPDGKTLAYAGALTDKKLNMHSGLYLYDLETGETKELFGPDRFSGLGSLAFVGDQLIFSAEEHGEDWMRFGGTNLYSF